MNKTCTKCGETKALELFPAAKRAKDGRDTRCKACACVATKAYVAANQEKVRLASLQRYQETREEQVKRSVAWQRANPERSRARRTNWRNANLEQARSQERAYELANRELLLAKKRIWAKANKAKYAAYATKRRAYKINAKALWADPIAILSIYEKCAELSRTTGVPHEVDHIVPLISNEVCGLHVEHNLQILTAYENRSKSNKLEQMANKTRG